MISKDIDLNFNINPITGDLNRKKDSEAVKQALRTLLLLGLFEKPFNSDLNVITPKIHHQNAKNIKSDDKLHAKIVANVNKIIRPNAIIYLNGAENRLIFSHFGNPLPASFVFSLKNQPISVNHK